MRGTRQVVVLFALIVVAFATPCPLRAAEPVGSAFTYQGALKRNGAPVTGNAA